MTAQTLSDVLWHERDLLELLLFKLKTEQLLLTAGETRYLHLAAREVTKVQEALARAGLGQELEAMAVAAAWGAPEDASLSTLIEHAPSDGPWKEILTGHREALISLTAQVKAIRDANAEHLAALNRSTQETVAALGPRAAGVYDATGTAAPRRGSLFDTTL